MTLPRILVWDLPTRLFHWSLVLLVAGAVVTGKVGGNLIDWHGRIGLALTGLVSFRLVWGLVGSTYARFASFVPTPGRIVVYLHGRWQAPGHNPLGALAVFALLALIAVQIGTGLAGNDDIAFRGPLFDLVGKELSDRLNGLHKLSVNALLALIALHVAAIVFYVRIKKDNLVAPMLSGRKTHSGKAASGGGPLALIVALAIAAATVYVASGAWLPAPPPAAAAPTPAW